MTSNYVSLIKCMAATCLAISLSACTTNNEWFDPSKPHHRVDGFVNLYPSSQSDEDPSFLRWQLERALTDLTPDQPSRVPQVVSDINYLRENKGDTSFTWLGHSTTLWQLGGLNILTDPHFSARASPVQFAGPLRQTPVPLNIEQLPHIDVVLISHNHYDHLDLGTVRALAMQTGGAPLFIVPLGVDKWLSNEGIDKSVRMDWWDHIEIQGSSAKVEFHFVPAHHWSSRTLWDRRKTLWGGFVAQTRMNGDLMSIYYSGDTGYAPDFIDIGRRFGGFDIAVIPVGCYLPRWFMKDQHVNEEDAVKIHLDVKSRLSIGVHWGTFRLCDDPIDAPIDGLPIALSKSGVSKEEFALPVLGQTRVLRRMKEQPSN